MSTKARKTCPPGTPWLTFHFGLAVSVEFTGTQPLRLTVKYGWVESLRVPLHYTHVPVSTFPSRATAFDMALYALGEAKDAIGHALAPLGGFKLAEFES